MALLLLLALSVGVGACRFELPGVDVLPSDWEFRQGFRPTYLAEPFGSWPRRSFPRFYSKEDGIAKGWITVRQRVPKRVISGLPEGRSLALNPGWLSDVSRIYWNGERIGGMGRVSPYQPGAQRFYLLEVPAKLIRRDKPNVITIVLYGNGTYRLESFHPVKLGPVTALAEDHFAAEILSFVLLGVYLVVGLYHLLLFGKRPKDQHNLFFGLFCVGLCLYWFCRIPSRDWLFGDALLWRYRVELLVLFFLGPALILFLSTLFYQTYARVGLALVSFAAILSVALLFSSPGTADSLLLVWQLIAIPFMLYVIYYIFRALLEGNREARYILAGVGLLMLSGVHDIFVDMGFVHHPQVARYSFVVFVFGVAVLLANRFMRVHNSVEELNAHLEDKVEERTQELQNTLSEVQSLKEQQDGDYFLTSLLIEPLGKIVSRSRTVNIDVFVRQKKRFRFRKWEAEIGGDLCAADALTLRGLRYTVFLNGDAMGKSMQGAGGAIVLGTVFRSVISRTKLSQTLQTRHPEQWLKECFVELQSVFVPFNGSMLASAVIGLVEDQTGMLYYVNAEHPGVAMLRGGRARFLRSPWQLRKIGVEGLDGVLSVNTLRLLPGDVLILGSDGRDDIMVGLDPRGVRIINEDEERFLGHVERAEGRLDRIATALEESGGLTDDLSLMRVGYREDAALQPQPEKMSPDERNAILTEARQALPENAPHAARLLRNALERSAGEGEADFLWVLSQAELQLGHASEAADLSVRASALAPEDSRGLLRVCAALRSANRWEEAIGFGERYRLRDPIDVQNLTDLADCYTRVGNDARAEMLLGLVSALTPDAPEPSRLLQALGEDARSRPEADSTSFP